MLLVVIHAVIIGYVRSEAARVRIAASNEIPIGVYYVQSADHQWLNQLRVHLLVKPERRLAAKAIFEHNRWLIHEVIEEKLRQLDPALLHDVVLLKVKEEIKAALDETMRDDVIEQVLVNDRVALPINRFEYPLPRDLTEPEALYTSVTSANESHVSNGSLIDKDSATTDEAAVEDSGGGEHVEAEAHHDAAAH